VQRDVEGVRDLMAADYTWHQRREWPGREVYTREELPELWAELDDTSGNFELTPTEYSEVGDCVLVEVHIKARVGATDDWVEGVIWHVWWIDDGLATQTRVFSDREEALEACA
jgi:ketosteroid isomerase-like protein